MTPLAWLRLQRFRWQIRRMQARRAKQLGLKEWHGFTDEEIDAALAIERARQKRTQ